MSNRKVRTARSDFLYEMARLGIRFFSSRTENDILLPLEKDGLVKRGRTQARDVTGHWKGDRRRNTFWEITEKGYLLLAKRAGSNDNTIRVHTRRNIYFNIDRFSNRIRRPIHELISETINFPNPGELKTPPRRMSKRRRKRY